jgi:CRISPR/Cas system-associated exonuclease Cas4 (RecB family)
MKFSPYSPSKMDCYQSCAYKFKLRYIDKITTETTDNTALKKGFVLHYLLETFPKGKINCDLTSYNGITEIEEKEYLKIYNNVIETSVVSELLNYPSISIEQSFGLDKRLNPVPYYSKEKVVGGIIDRLIMVDNTITVVDWKTGKPKEYHYFSNNHQIVLYAIWVFKMFPVDFVQGKYVYVEHNETRDFLFTREHLNNYAKAIGSVIKEIETDEKFSKTTKLCKWCDYFKAGICKP